MVPKKVIYGGLSLVLSGLRWSIWVAVGANIAIEIREVYLHKDVHHLALSAIFFLLANIQIGISRLLVSMNDEQASRKFFHISIFMICAAIVNLVDLKLDRVLSRLADESFVYVYRLLSIVEFMLGTLSTILAGYSLDRFFVLIKIKSRDLVG